MGRKKLTSRYQDVNIKGNSAFIGFRCPMEIYRLIQKRASQLNLLISEYMRQILRSVKDEIEKAVEEGERNQ